MKELFVNTVVGLTGFAVGIRGLTAVLSLAQSIIGIAVGVVTLVYMIKQIKKLRK